MTTDRAHQLAAIRAWTRAQEASRRAYHEDVLIAAGLCVRCGTNNAGWSHVCLTCSKRLQNEREAARRNPS